MPNLKPIRTEEDYDAALSEVERLWGAKLGTSEGDRLDVLVTAVDFEKGIVWIKWIGTHKEYDKIDVKKVKYAKP